MKLREEIVELITKEASPEEFVKLFRSWAEEILVELRHIRANAPLNEKTRTRERLRMLIEKIEEALEE